MIMHPPNDYALKMKWNYCRLLQTIADMKSRMEFKKKKCNRKSTAGKSDRTLTSKWCFVLNYEEKAFAAHCVSSNNARPTPIRSAQFSDKSFSASCAVVIPPVKITGMETRRLMAAVMS